MTWVEYKFINFLSHLIFSLKSYDEKGGFEDQNDKNRIKKEFSMKIRI